MQGMKRLVPAAFLAIGVSIGGMLSLATHEGTGPVTETVSGKVYHAYPDPGYGWKVPTICYGSTKNVKPGMTATEEECLDRLQDDLKIAAKDASTMVTVPLTQEQWEALTSFTYNVGITKLQRTATLEAFRTASTRSECLRAGEYLSKWVYSSGKRLKGLVERRADERRRWDAGCMAWEE